MWLLSALCCVCGVLGMWLLFTGDHDRRPVLRVRCPGPLGSCYWSPHPVCCAVSAVYWATWLLLTGVPARCVVLRAGRLGPLGSCSPICLLGGLHCVCVVPGHWASVWPCARLVRCGVCAVSSDTWILFTGVATECVVLRVRCPGPLGSCSPVCPLGALCCVCSVLSHLAPVHQCARSVGCIACALSQATGCARSVCSDACAVSWATWLLFTGVAAECGVLRVRCPGPCGSCSPLYPLGVLSCLCGYQDNLAPVDWCACSVRCVMCAASRATWLLFTGVAARCVVLRVRCPRPLGSCLTVCSVVVLCCVCGVLGHLAHVYRSARPWCCGVVLCVPCPGSLGRCSLM